MKNRQHDYKVVPYPKLRRFLEIMYPSVKRKPMIHGLLEVDVTRVREFLRDHQAKTGESLSFTAFIITCFARAIDENKTLHVCRKGGRHLILFDEVDVATPIERDMAGQKQPIVYIIRAANTKTFREIHSEIRAAQVEQNPELRSRPCRWGPGSTLHRAIERTDRKWLWPRRERSRETWYCSVSRAWG